MCFAPYWADFAFFLKVLDRSLFADTCNSILGKSSTFAINS